MGEESRCEADGTATAGGEDGDEEFALFHQRSEGSTLLNNIISIKTPSRPPASNKISTPSSSVQEALPSLLRHHFNAETSAQNILLRRRPHT